MSVQVGASCLEKARGGKGVLLGGVPGTRRGRVVILGAGVVGRNPAAIAVGMGAHVTVLDIRPEAMSALDDRFSGAVQTLYANSETIESLVLSADLVIGAVLIPGTRAPLLVTDTLVAQMERGSVIVDVAVDQGGCFGTSHPTTHDNPIYDMYGVVHYCVSNMPGAVSHTSTWALTNATLQHAVDIADLGIRAAARADSALARGINTFDGHITYASVATAHGAEYVPLERLLKPVNAASSVPFALRLLFVAQHLKAGYIRDSGHRPELTHTRDVTTGVSKPRFRVSGCVVPLRLYDGAERICLVHGPFLQESVSRRRWHERVACRGCREPAGARRHPM